MSIEIVEVESSGLTGVDVSYDTGTGISVVEVRQGPAGDASASSASVTSWHYRAKTNATSGYPGNGYVLWNNATQTSATNLLFAHIDSAADDIELILGFIKQGNRIFVQDRDSSADYQIWTVSGTPTLTGANTSTAYYTYPVTLVSSAGAGTTGFSNNTQLLVGLTQTLALHASTHAAGGTDPITPVSIGAATAAQGAKADTAVQPLADLVTLGSGAQPSGRQPIANGTGGVAWQVPVAYGDLFASNNLSDLDSASTARTNLGLGTAATTASTDYVAVTGNQTIAGNKTLSGQTELTGQAATNSTSAMTRGLVDRRMMDQNVIILPSENMISYLSGSGSVVQNAPAAGRVNSGTTTGSVAKLSYQNSITSLALDGDAFATVPWDEECQVSFVFQINGCDANTVARFVVGETWNSSSASDLSLKGFGIKIENLALKLMVHDGSTLTTTGTLSTLTEGVRYTVRIVSDGNGNAQLFLNGSSIGTTTGAPTAISGNAENGVSFSVTNGAGTSGVYMDVAGCVKFGVFP